MTDSTRRTFLGKGLTLAIATTVIGQAATAGPATAEPNTHAPWRFCVKCFSMFYWGFVDSGQCPKDFGPHQSAGWYFKIPWGNPGTPTDQPDWRCCGLCLRLFYGGNLSRHGCTLARSHSISSAFPFNYVLPHDIPENRSQDDWRYCRNCQVLFFSGYPEQGTCKYGGPHDGDDLNYVIPVSSYT